MSNITDKSFKIGKLYISHDDYYILSINLLMLFMLCTILYLKKLRLSIRNISVVVKNNFTFLGEGVMSNFYSPLNPTQKNPSTKKKVASRSGGQINQPVEKQVNNNELKCNSCGRSVEVSYQFTMHKLNSINC